MDESELRQLRKDIDRIDRTLEDRYVTIERFRPFESMLKGFIATIGLGIAAAILRLVLIP